MTTKFLDNIIFKFKFFLVMVFPKKNSVWVRISSLPSTPPPLKNRKFDFYCRLAVMKGQLKVFSTIKSASVPVTGGSVPPYGAIGSPYGGIRSPYGPLLIVQLSVSGLGPLIVGFWGVSKKKRTPARVTSSYIHIHFFIFTYIFSASGNPSEKDAREG